MVVLIYRRDAKSLLPLRYDTLRCGTIPCSAVRFCRYDTGLCSAIHCGALHSCRYVALPVQYITVPYGAIQSCRYITLLYDALLIVALLLGVSIFRCLSPRALGPTVYRVRGQFVKFDLHFVDHCLQPFHVFAELSDRRIFFDQRLEFFTCL